MTLRIPKGLLVAIGVVVLLTISILVGVVTSGVLDQQKNVPASLAAANVPTQQSQATATSAPRPAPTKTTVVQVPAPVRTRYVPEPYQTSDGGSWHSLVTAEGTNVYVRTAPSTSASPAGKLPTASSVNVECWVTGDTVSGNSIWDRVSDPYFGYVADNYVADTGSVPAC